jgi:cytochrome c peroxidase
MKIIHAIMAIIALGTIPQVSAQSRQDARVTLGRRLFYDADLSRDGTMSCGTCHEQRHGFGDGNKAHPGVTDEPGRRNVPGLANVGRFSPLTWADPRQTTLEKQVAVPVFGTHPVEMGMAGIEAQIPTRFGRDPCYRQMFAAAFPGRGQKITFTKIAQALASFERSMMSRDTPFDRHILSPGAKAGWVAFRRSCASCHKGPDFTDMAFHRLTPVDRAAPDQGLYEATAKEADRGRFRTPSLRNVAVTAPYWHDGAAPTLSDAIRRHGFTISPADAGAIEVFLGALTDTTFLNNRALALPQTACGKPL